MFDAVVVGGGVAGLSAALVLGRSRRRALVLDGGAPRNALSQAAHSIFTRDGTPPLELLRLGREQLEPYPSVEFRPVTAASARAIETGFEVSLSQGGPVECRRLLLAHGVVDDLPDVAGLEPLWGRSAFHCPYCDGWEVRDQPLALYAPDEGVPEFVVTMLGWSRDLVLCSDGPARFTEDERAHLARHAIALREEPILRLEGTDGRLERIVFAGGASLTRKAIFLHPKQHLGTELAQRLGCELTDAGLISSNEWGETTVPGVYAAGDIMSHNQQVIRAAATGAAAAIKLNGDLLGHDFC